MKILYFLWGILCFIGNLYQLYLIFNRYFQYDVSTNVQIYTPEQIDVPTVIVCMNAHKLIRWENVTMNELKVLLTSDGYAEGIKGKNIYEKLTKFTDKQLLNFTRIPGKGLKIFDTNNFT